jgi:hypothetical protein
MRTKFWKLSGVAVIAVFVSFTGCEGLLDVENPNNVLEEDLNDPATAAALANGSLATVSQGIGYVMAPYTTVSDEVRWIGSRDAWGQLDNGIVGDINNEFVDGAWPFITEARYMADKAVTLIEGFDGQNRLTNRLDLVRAYVYAALVRVVIADMFDDFVFSNKTDVRPPIGEANMSQLYDQAIALLDKALPIAQASTAAASLEQSRRVLALRARAKHAKAVWGKLNPKGTVPSNPWVDAAGAEADALAMLAVSGTPADWKWILNYFSALTFNETAWELVGRSELAFEATPNDPITGAADPRIAATITDFRNTTAYQDRYSPLTMGSAREMHLIIAEAYLARGDSATARTRLNTVRALNSMTPISTENVGTMLRHERRANLFLQGRRLNDMYRFGIQDARWLPAAEARVTPGSFFPVTIRERRANPAYR